MPGPIPHGARPLTTVISFPGFPSGPQEPSLKTDLIRELGHHVALVATNGDYRPCGYPVALGRLGLDPTTPQVLMGNSLGGFRARPLGQEPGRPWIALNPAIQPSQPQRRHLGTTTASTRGGPSPGQPQIARRMRRRMTRCSIIGWPGTRVVLLSRGGHQLHPTEDYLAAVGIFLSLVAEGPSPLTLTDALANHLSGG